MKNIKPSISIKIAVLLMVVMNIPLLSGAIDLFKIQAYEDGAWMIFQILTSLFIAWGIYSLKKWAPSLGILSQIAVIVISAINTPFLLSILPISSGLVRENLFTSVVVLSAFIVGLGLVLIPAIYIIVVLVKKRKEFIY